MMSRSTPVAVGSAPRTSRPLIPLGRRSSLLLLGVSIVGMVAYTWPLFVNAEPTSGLAHTSDAPWVFMALLPLLLGIIVSELADSTLDAKAIAVLGVLTACGAVLRLPSVGTGGFTPMFFLLLPAARVFGKGFGFVLGALTMFVSALITGGVGPWLPYQMLGTAWVGFLAGCLPRRVHGRAELWMLALYGMFAGLAYGLLLNMWFWPFATFAEASTAYVPGAAVLENLRRFMVFDITTSLGFDIPRAVGNVVLILVAGRPVMVVLRRAAHRASFGVRPEFVELDGAAADGGAHLHVGQVPIIDDNAARSGRVTGKA